MVGIAIPGELLPGQVDGDGVEPGPDAGGVAEGSAPLDGPDEGELGDVLGEGGVAEQPSDEVVDVLAISLEQSLGACRIPGLERSGQGLIIEGRRSRRRFLSRRPVWGVPLHNQPFPGLRLAESPARRSCCARQSADASANGRIAGAATLRK